MVKCPYCDIDLDKTFDDDYLCDGCDTWWYNKDDIQHTLNCLEIYDKRKEAD